MKVFILGMGHVGKALAKALKSKGHTVYGSTTTEAKVAELSTLVDQVFVLKGEEQEKLNQALNDIDLVVLTVAPNVRQTRTKEERELHYHQVLELSAKHVAQACNKLVFLSSFSVYGDGSGEAVISEQSPTSNHEEPSSKYYQRAEQAILTREGGCVLRFPDMYGAPGDLDFPQRVRMALDYFNGMTLFSADAPLYAIHFEDVVQAVLHAIEQQLTGIYNVCDNQLLPPTNQQVFDLICTEQGWPTLGYLSQIKAPLGKISSDKLYASGYQVAHSHPYAALGQPA